MLRVTGAATLMRGRSAATPAAPASPAPVLFRNVRREMPEVIRLSFVDRVCCFTAGSSRLVALWTRIPSARPGDVGVRDRESRSGGRRTHREL